MTVQKLETLVEEFDQWLQEAEKTEISDANAMSLATVNKEGRPSVRTVLLKEYSANGFVFFTNSHSRKGKGLLETHKAALCFYWKSLGRQVHVEGQVVPVSAEKSDSYFATRPRESQLGAWASLQSEAMDTEQALKERLGEFEKRYPKTVPRPDHWIGFCVVPERIEFWTEGASRLHTREVYSQIEGTHTWTLERLYP